MKLNLDNGPKEGDTRIVKGFALFPKIIDENTKVWLESYQRTEVYVKPFPMPGIVFYPRWEVMDPQTGRCYMPHMYHREAYWREVNPKPPKPPQGMGSGIQTRGR